MRRALCVALVAHVLLASHLATAVRRDDDEASTDTHDSVPVQASDQPAQTMGQMPASVAEKLPKHLAEHYQKKGLDNVVYFSFCIA
jgi:hypothetical protein